jgi:hypothetical protein
MNGTRRVTSDRNKRARALADELRRELPDLLLEIALQTARPGDRAELDRAIQSVTAHQLAELVRAGLACAPARSRPSLAPVREAQSHPQQPPTLLHQGEGIGERGQVDGSQRGTACGG